MFKRTTKELRTLKKLDKLMARMASDDTYDEYIFLRGEMESGYKTV